MIGLIFHSWLFAVCSLLLPPRGAVNHAWRAGGLLGRHPPSTHSHTVLPVWLLLERIMSVLAALPLSSMFLSCLARISVFHITENRSVCFHETKILLFIFRKWRGRSPFGQSVDYTTPTINKCCTPHQYKKVCTVIAGLCSWQLSFLHKHNLEGQNDPRSFHSNKIVCGKKSWSGCYKKL